MERHWLFEVMDGEDEGVEFIVCAPAMPEAFQIAIAVFDEPTGLKCYGEISEEEAEMSGLDEY